ncbi:alpha-amylase family glycosyl hydrolase [Bhargavaea ullalensis]|uniref:Glycosidase n=1 Tax=Bhargavaea ullalensis TaxID=1265685 RepID=A0ABV2GC82_9BACL
MIKKSLAALSAAIFIGTAGWVPAASAAGDPVLDDSIYDTLVDRFFNGSTANDRDVDPADPKAFSGGDFEGLLKKQDYIHSMGFNAVSIGPVFSTDTYDGRRVLDYGTIEDRFGTEEELTGLVGKYHKKDMRLFADFPLGGASANHVWTADHDDWAIDAGDGTVNWDYDNPEVKEALIDAAVSFVKKTGIDGLRLTHFGDADKGFLNDLIKALKSENGDLLVFSDAPSDANFDLIFNEEESSVLRETFSEVDPDSDGLNHTEMTEPPSLLFFDTLEGDRFTAEMVEKRMFPPTRWKIAATALLTLPGVPIMTYGSETAVTGTGQHGNHPNHDFKSDEDLIDHITNVNELRNQSETLRSGKFEMLYNEDGMIVYKRFTDDETWIIALNNTSETQRIDISEEQAGGAGKTLRALFGNDLVRQTENGSYRVVLDRETADMFIVEEDKGLNIPYIIAAILVYTIFLLFIWQVWRKGRQRRTEGSK